MVELYHNDKKYFSNKVNIIAGIDEAGRGPIAGPLVVSGVILDYNKNILHEVNDSKKLSEKKRKTLFDLIIKYAVAYHIEVISEQIVDEINILKATLLGMLKVSNNLKLKSDLYLIDGNKLPYEIKDKSIAVVKGDSIHACIAAASILSKVYRDELMKKYDLKYPQYDFINNKGYPTKKHLQLLSKYGISPIHRKTYKPVKQFL